MISSQVPESLRETAIAHKKSLLDVAHILGPSYEENYNNHTKELERLRSELQSIAHERVVVDVLTRQTIRQAKKKPTQNNNNNNGSSSSSSMNKNKKTGPGSGSVGPGSQIPFEPIVIPSYKAFNPNHGATNDKTQTSGSDPNNKKQNNQTNEPPRMYARTVQNGSLMVPSMRQGILPPEIANLKTVPGSQNSSLKKRYNFFYLIYFFILIHYFFSNFLNVNG